MATTDMFKISPGFYIAKLDAVEQVAVRLASFASNTRSVERLHASALTTPRLEDMARIQLQQTQEVARYLEQTQPDASELANEILNLASSTYGLFFYLNNPLLFQRLKLDKASDRPLAQFWSVSDTTRDLFQRLAAHEATNALEHVHRRYDDRSVPLYPFRVVSLFRILDRKSVV